MSSCMVKRYESVLLQSVLGEQDKSSKQDKSGEQDKSSKHRIVTIRIVTISSCMVK